MILETSRIHIPAESDQATIVRQFVRVACHRYGCDAASDNVLQVTAELLSNALGHARHSADDTSEAGMEAAVDAGLDVNIVPTQAGLRVEVCDCTAPADRSAEPATASPLGQEDGWQGLRIVASLAQDWGIDEGASGTTLWAEMDTHA